MNLTFNELRKIKHSLPTGSVSKIATDLNITEQTVRNFFGAKKLKDGGTVSWHKQPGPHGGFVTIEDESILNAAYKILREGEGSN